MASNGRQDFQQMWLALLRAGWTSIAVVPTAVDLPVGEVIDAFVDVTRDQPAGAFRVIDAQGASVPEGSRLCGELEGLLAEGRRAVIAVDSLMKSLAGVPLVRRADAAVLVVSPGEGSLDAVTSTLEIIGRGRILGSVTLTAGD